jgi:hypothetical protein
MSHASATLYPRFLCIDVVLADPYAAQRWGTSKQAIVYMSTAITSHIV